MDRDAFDLLARRCATITGRRRLLGGLVTGLATATLPWSGTSVAAACKKVGKRCDRGKDCCDKAKCKNGKCRCKDGFKNCGGKCKKLEKDAQHCGQCNQACAGGERCCDGTCADLDFDHDHCGACGNACAPAEECIGGTCRPIAGSCLAGSSHCLEAEAVPCPDEPGCRCQRSVEGHTICAESITPDSFCGNCETSADCVELFGRNSFCMVTDGPKCCGPNPMGICRRPCQLLPGP